MDEARQYLDWSYATLAKEAGGSKSSWHGWLKGDREITEYFVKRGVDAMVDALDARSMVLDDANLVAIQDSLRLVPKLWGKVRMEAVEPETSPVVPVLRDDQLCSAADRLAGEIERQWLLEADRRRLRLPGPIPVRWQWAPGMTSQPGVVANDPSWRSPVFTPLPGAMPVTTERLRSGGLKELFDIYAGVDSGRIVLLGGPGAGKSAAAILALLTAVRHRGTLDKRERAAVPVPVLLTTHGWDPCHQRLGEWLARRLAEDHSFLGSRRNGVDLAEELVVTGGIALFLDGFDEMDARLHPHALAEISRQTTFRLVIVTRTEQFADVVSGIGHVDAAAAVELLPVSPGDAATYLDNLQRDVTRPPSERLSAHLRQQPGSVLSRALSSPLNLTLLRDVRDPADVAELLTPDRFSAPEEVEAELLDRFIAATYLEPLPSEPPGINPQRAKLALGYLATCMNERGIRDLAWWQLDRWAGRSPRLATAAVMGLVVGALVGAAAFGPLGRYTVRGATGVLFGTVYLSAMGCAFGLLTGLVSELRERLPFAGRFNPASGLLVGLAIGLAVGNQSHYLFGIVGGLGAAVVAATAATRLLPDTAGSPWWTTLLARVDPASAGAAGLPVGLTYGLTRGPVHGFVAGAVAAIAFSLMVGFSRPSTVTAADPYTSWRRSRDRAVHFGVAAGLAIGVPLGLKNATAHGPLAGLVAGTGFAVIVGLGCLVGASDSWRTSMVFLQLHSRGIPMRGMRFLEDAHRRGVLRTVGPLFQFRHPDLQDRLAEAYQESTWNIGCRSRWRWSSSR